MPITMLSTMLKEIKQFNQFWHSRSVDAILCIHYIYNYKIHVKQKTLISNIN